MKLRGYGSTTTETSAAPDTRSNGRHADTAPAPILSVSGLRFGYPSRPDVLHDVSITISPGARVGLIGPNGAGKTSLFLAIAGVLKATAGEVTLAGEPMRYNKFHPEIGLVFQNADDQLFSPTVRDDVAFGPTNMRLPAPEIAARVEAALTTVGALELAERPPHHLSGGEKRMVAIAGVLALHPRVIMYDEPDANLDVRARRRLIRFLQASEQTLLIASHDLGLILEVCDRVLLLDEGRIVADGDPRAIMGDAALMETHGLEKPHSLIPHTHEIPCP
ncbi:MAG: energy-coupling factor ABC transporter ATP-binding protein [Anaerolineae bacterium]|nr:energy-coupling factor ABC transporter ATP-binding protein [Anaerolineae bacterium]